MMIVRHGAALPIPDVPEDPTHARLGSGAGSLELFGDIAALVRNEDHFRTLAQLARTLGWAADPDGNLLWVDPRWARLTGRPQGQVLGQGWASFVHPDDLADAYAAWAIALASGRPLYAEWRFLARKGVHRWMRVRAQPRRNDDGRIVRWYGTLEDVNARKMADERLRESEGRFRAIADSAPVIAWTSDAKGLSTFHSRHWHEFTGQSGKAAEGKGWSLALHPDDRARVAKEFAAATQAQAPFSMEYRLKRADGEYRWVLVQATPQPFREGRFQGFVGTTIDITERKAAESRLLESEARFRAMADNAPVMVWVTEADGTTSFISRSWQQFTGLNGEVGQSQEWIMPVHPDDREVLERTFRAAQEAQVPFRAEYRLRRADGQYRWVIDAGSPRLNSEGRFQGYIGSVLDIADRKAAEEAQRKSEERLRIAQWAGGIATWEWDIRTGETSWSGTMRDLLGLSPNCSASIEAFFKAVSHDDRARVEAELAQALAHGGHFTSEFRVMLSDGSPRWLLGSGEVTHDEHGVPVRFIMALYAITLRKRAEEAARTTSEKLATVLECTMTCVLVLDPDWRITYVNSRAMAALPEGPALLGQDLRGVMNEPLFLEQCGAALQKLGSVEFEGFFPQFDQWLSVHAVGRSDGLIVFFKDVTAEREARELIAFQAHHDALTGLPNRFAFRKQLTAALADEQAGVALLLLDLDDFKGINDGLGHPMGDELLKAASRALQGLQQHIGLISRLGGDEFAVIAKVSDSRQAQDIAEAVLGELQKPFTIAGRAVRTGVSIGIAMGRAGQDTDELFAQADMALYAAKAAGGSCHRLFELVLQHKAKAEAALKQDLSLALKGRQLVLDYQPQIELQTGAIAGLEALLRWEHPMRGRVSPADFIAVAEQTGLIHEIGEWVLRQACTEAKGWPLPVSVAVNLSPIQFRNKGLPLRIVQALQGAGLPASRLKVEITENVLLHDSASNLATLAELRRLGVKISLDDFGTGYSSLSYLRTFRFDEIKLDQAFVQDIGQGGPSEAIIRAVLDLGRSLGIKTTAEGVETPEQLAWLKAAGCDFGQGYLFSRPVAAAKARDMLNRPSNEEALRAAR